MHTYSSTRVLSQLKGVEPVKEITTDDNITFKLVKSAFDSSIGIPDPTQVFFTDAWCKEYPNTNGSVWCYCCQGIKRPSSNTEKPTLVLYTWFSTQGDPSFNPSTITRDDWLRACVYAYPLSNHRNAIFNGLCGVSSAPKQSFEESLISLPMKENTNNGVS
jgi:hypothetical protein